MQESGPNKLSHPVSRQIQGIKGTPRLVMICQTGISSCYFFNPLSTRVQQRLRRSLTINHTGQQKHILCSTCACVYFYITHCACYSVFVRITQRMCPLVLSRLSAFSASSTYARNEKQRADLCLYSISVLPNIFFVVTLHANSGPLPSFKNVTQL